MDVVAPHLASGQLVQVLQPWTYGQLTLYAALPSRQFLPQRTRVFLDFLTEQTRLLVAKALVNAAPPLAPRPPCAGLEGWLGGYRPPRTRTLRQPIGRAGPTAPCA